MRDVIEAALRGHNADHIELCLEESKATPIVYRGRELEDIGRGQQRGGCSKGCLEEQVSHDS